MIVFTWPCRLLCLTCGFDGSVTIVEDDYPRASGRLHAEQLSERFRIARQDDTFLGLEIRCLTCDGLVSKQAAGCC